MENIFNRNYRKDIKVKRGEAFDCDRLQIDLGLWLGLFKKPSKMPGYVWESLVKGRLVNLAREGVVKPEVLNSIQDKFLELIAPAINGQSVYSLYGYDHDKGSFKCEFENGDNIDIDYSFGWIEEGPMITFKSDKEKVQYAFYEERENRPACLKLMSVVRRLGNDLTFNHYVFRDSYYATLGDKNKSIVVTIDYIRDMPVEDQVDKEVLERMISKLSLDASLDEICKSIIKGIKVGADMVKMIKVEKKGLVIEHRGSQPISKIREMVSFSNGEIKDLIFIRDGKSVHVNDFTAWSYKDNKFSVSGNDEQNMYSVTVTADSDKLDEAIVPRDYVRIAKDEVLKTKKLSLAPIKKRLD